MVARECRCVYLEVLKESYRTERIVKSDMIGEVDQNNQKYCENVGEDGRRKKKVDGVRLRCRPKMSWTDGVLMSLLNIGSYFSIIWKVRLVLGHIYIYVYYLFIIHGFT